MSPLKNSGPLTPTCPFDPGLCDAPMKRPWAGRDHLLSGGRRNTPGGQTQTPSICRVCIAEQRSEPSSPNSKALTLQSAEPASPDRLFRKDSNGVRWRSCRGSACQDTAGPQEPSSSVGGNLPGGHDSPEEQSVSQGALNLSVTQKHLEGCGHTGAGPSPEG